MCGNSPLKQQKATIVFCGWKRFAAWNIFFPDGFQSTWVVKPIRCYTIPGTRVIYGAVEWNWTAAKSLYMELNRQIPDIAAFSSKVVCKLIVLCFQAWYVHWNITGDFLAQPHTWIACPQINGACCSKSMRGIMIQANKMLFIR